MLAILGGDRDDAWPIFGCSQHSSQGGDTAAREEPRGHAICGDHEILDGSCAIFHLWTQIRQLVAVKHGVRLDRLQRQGAVHLSGGLQPLRGSILHAQLQIEVGDRGHRRGQRPLALEPRTDGGVSELGMIADERRVKL